MIVLAGLLWVQTALLATIGVGGTITAARDETMGAKPAIIVGVVFTFMTVVSAVAALAVGGIA